MVKHDWEARLERRHAAPPPAPAGEWGAIQARLRPAPRAFRRPLWAWGGGLALAGLLTTLVCLPLHGPRTGSAAGDLDTAPVDQWVSQQWTQQSNGQSAEAEPGANYLALLDVD
jgi:hypothetical protein